MLGAWLAQTGCAAQEELWRPGPVGRTKSAKMSLPSPYAMTNGKGGPGWLTKRMVYPDLVITKWDRFVAHRIGHDPQWGEALQRATTVISAAICMPILRRAQGPPSCRVYRRDQVSDDGSRPVYPVAPNIFRLKIGGPSSSVASNPALLRAPAGTWTSVMGTRLIFGASQASSLERFCCYLPPFAECFTVTHDLVHTAPVGRAHGPAKSENSDLLI
jgi:hypothetical protein